MKKGTLHREWSLWNQLVLNKSDLDNNFVDYNNNEKIERSDITETRNLNEKSELNSTSNFYNPYNYNDEKKKVFKSFKVPSILKKMLVILLMAYNIFYYLLPNNHENKPNFSLANLQDFSLDSLNSLSSNESHSIIDIPFLPYSNISSPVYSTLLLNHTFGSSWNKPASVIYYPPPSNITYNKIILTLNTSIDGVQYDRLIHIYLNDTEIWRSSTIEPAGRLSNSFTQKDVTMYSSLFNQNGSLLIQLDNLVTKRLTGKFDIEIKALYFNDNLNELNELNELNFNDLSHNPFGKEISNNNHPTFVPLTPNKIADNIPPIVYYPDSDLSNLNLPLINYNTTKLLLLISTSGNAAEEFWYSNLVDEYKDHFLNYDHHFYGHGSCRVINVYINGIRVHSTNPKPYIFTGGIAPTLWNPIVSTGSFNLLPYHIDLTPILPLLWETPNSILNIEISNCIDDDEKSIIKSGIGSNWITSASLAIWEDENIDDSYGTFEILDNSTKIKSFAIAPPFSGMLTQIIKADYKNSLQSNLTYIYKNGTELTTLENSENLINQTSMIFVTKFGDSQSVLSILKSNSTKSLIDPFTFDPLDNFSMLSKNTLKSKLNFLKSEIVDDINFNVNVSVDFKTGAYSNLLPLAEIKSKENGTADFTLSSSGNHGTGSVLHNYTLSTIDDSTYSRIALAENGTIAFDNITVTDSTDSTETIVESPILSNNRLFLNSNNFNWLSENDINEIEDLLDDREIAEFVSAFIEKKHEHCHQN